MPDLEALEATAGPLVYLIHLDKRYYRAQHYLGYADHLAARMKHHRAGSGAKFLAAVVQAGIAFQVVRVWPGMDRTFERRLKKTKHAWRYCPICRATRHTHEWQRAQEPKEQSA